jgi:hypothetical protein
MFMVLLGMGCTDDSYLRVDGANGGDNNHKAVASCQTACNADTRCGAYTVNITSGRCALKETCVAAQRIKFSHSGIKFGTPLPSTILESGPATPATTPVPPPPPLAIKTKQSVFYAYPAFYCKSDVLVSSFAESARVCRIRCKMNDKCMAFSFHVVNKACELKRTCREMLPSAPWLTGFLLANPHPWYP